MTTLDWLIVLVVNGAVIAYGLYLARGTETSGEWFLGGRALPWWAVGLSMFATNVDNADLVGVTGKTYTTGLQILSVYALGSAVGGILAAFFIVPAIYRAGFYTNAEYLEARYGPWARAVSALVQIQYRGSMLGMMIYSSHLLLTELAGIGSITSWGLIVALVVLAGLYTAWGGLKSVVWTDAAQGIVMMIAGGVIFFAVRHAVGGWEVASQRLVDTGRGAMLHIGRYTEDDGATPAWMVALGWTIIGAGYWTVNHTQTMRLMGSRSLWDMRVAALWGVSISLPIMMISASIGVFARALPDLSDVRVADSVYPLLAQRYLTVGWKGIVVAGVVAAVTSTFDSMGSALSAIFTRDLYARFLVRNRPDAHYVLVGRVATVCVLAVGFLYLPLIFRKRNMIDAFTTLIPVFVTPLFTIYMAGVLTRVHRRGGLVGLLTGSVYGVIALWDREFGGVAWAPDWLTNKSPALCWSILITAAPMVVTTLWLGRAPDRKVRAFRESGWLQRSRDELPVLKEHPFETEVPLWANPLPWAVACLAGSVVVLWWFW